MALKALMLRKKLDLKNNELRENETAFNELVKRESELEKAIEEATTDEERSVVEESVADFERDKKNLEDTKKSLEEAIAAIEKELAELEKEEPKDEEPKDEEPKVEESKENERKVNFNMETRTLKSMNMNERTLFLEREDVKEFISKVRTAITEKRSIENAGLLIPTTMLPMIRAEVENASKLISKVNHVTLNGTGRSVVQGTIPEAVWTEMCGNLNELTLAFNDVELDGYKVGGFFAICNAQLEDSDYDLAEVLTTTIGQAIGKALDKAILYGTGTKMPLGIAARIGQTAKPANYSATARAWENLSTSHVIKSAGGSILKELIKAAGTVKNEYYSDGLVWVMNEATKFAILSEAMEVNANGAIVAGMSNAMPIVGGEIIVCNDVADNNIIFGYGKAYVLGERKGVQLATSEHAKFVEDKTVFKGTARYDGQPAIAEAFAIFITDAKGTAVTSATFAADSANAQG